MKKRIKKILKEFKSDLKKNLKELTSLKTFYRQIPNILTSIRAFAPIPFNILYFTGNLKGAVLVLMIAFFTDAIDGKIARKYGLVSKFGATLDAVCDKLMVIGVIIPVCTRHYGLIINLCLELIIALTNILASLLNIKTKSSMIGKLKTWPLFITIILAYINLFLALPKSLLICMITLTAGLQVFTTLDYVSKNLQQYQQLTTKR